MPIAKPSLQFFGLDLSALWPEVRQAWQGVHQWPVMAWLTPSAPVRVLHANGLEASWLAGRKIAAAPIGGERFAAIEIPDDLLLRRFMIVPAMAQVQVTQAVELEVRSANPFPVADLLWGYSVQPEKEGLRIEAVMASRKQVEGYIASQQHRLEAGSDTVANAHEVWVFTLDNTPIILSGWGEGRRIQYGDHRRHGAYVLVAAAMCLVVAMAATPTMQLRWRTLEAVNAFEALQTRTAPLVGQREEYMRSVAQLESLKGLLQERAEPLLLLESLTRTLPDNTSLQSLEVRGLKVTLNGLTGNAATLMQLLGATEGFRDVRAPSPATRNPGADAENFIVELQLDPALFSMAGAAPAGNSLVSETVPANAALKLGVLTVTASPVTSNANTNEVANPTLSSSPATEVAPQRRKSRFSSGPEGPPPQAPTPVLSAPASAAHGNAL